VTTMFSGGTGPRYVLDLQSHLDHNRN
jgi:hypothetical protein